MVLLKVVGDDGMCEGVRRRRRGRERLVEIPIYHMRRNNGKNPLNAEQMDFTSVARRWNTSEDSRSLATSVNVGHYYSLVGWED